MIGLYILSGALLLGIGAALGYYVGYVYGWGAACSKAERDMVAISKVPGMGRR